MLSKFQTVPLVLSLLQSVVFVPNCSSGFACMQPMWGVVESCLGGECLWHSFLVLSMFPSVPLVLSLVHTVVFVPNSVPGVACMQPMWGVMVSCQGGECLWHSFLVLSLFPIVPLVLAYEGSGGILSGWGVLVA